LVSVTSLNDVRTTNRDIYLNTMQGTSEEQPYADELDLEQEWDYEF
jgi:hypothetical protein